MANPFTEEDVRHIAKLARLKLSDAEIQDQTQKLAAVLQYIAKLEEVDVEGVEPMAHAMDMSNVLRQDEEDHGRWSPQDILKNAPGRDESDGPFFSVPKVLGDGGGA